MRWKQPKKNKHFAPENTGGPLKIQHSMLGYLSAASSIAQGSQMEQPKLQGITKHKKCVHGTRKSRCIKCNESELCKHCQRKSRCIKGGGSEICIHSRRRDNCQDCRCQRKKKPKHLNTPAAMMDTNEKDETDESYKMRISFICSDQETNDPTDWVCVFKKK
jgi:hypothetical protein